tara:strand:- start:199 stop:564 length:366 start_codon:yes stop_codon:yes gene_type:complete
MKKNKTQLSFAVRNFVFFFKKMDEVFYRFQTLLASKSGMLLDCSFSPEEEGQIYKNTRILYLRAIGEYKEVEHFSTKYTAELKLPEAGMTSRLHEVGLTIIQYEQLRMDERIDDYDDYDKF